MASEHRYSFGRNCSHYLTIYLGRLESMVSSVLILVTDSTNDITEILVPRQSEELS